MAVALVAFAAGVAASWALVTRLFEFGYRPDWTALGTIPASAILLAVIAALAAALPALNARPAEGLRSL